MLIGNARQALVSTVAILDHLSSSQGAGPGESYFRIQLDHGIQLTVEVKASQDDNPHAFRTVRDALSQLVDEFYARTAET